jgi:hypothetical protein
VEAFEQLICLSVFLSGLAFVVIAFVVGQFLDAIRDLLEGFWECAFIQKLNWKFTKKIDWKYFFTEDEDKLKNFEAYYWIYYAFDWNLAIGIILSILFLFFLWWLSFIQTPGCRALCVASVVAAVGLLVFIGNAISLRREISEFMPKPNKEKHEKKG